MKRNLIGFAAGAVAGALILPAVWWWTNAQHVRTHMTLAGMWWGILILAGYIGLMGLGMAHVTKPSPPSAYVRKQVVVKVTREPGLQAGDIIVEPPSTDYCAVVSRLVKRDE